MLLGSAEELMNFTLPLRQRGGGKKTRPKVEPEHKKQVEGVKPALSAWMADRRNKSLGQELSY